MSDTPTPVDPDSDPPANDPTPVYDVTGVPTSGADHAYPSLRALSGALLPRRRDAGRRGVLLVDRPQQVVYLLDADDDAETFRYRDTRPLAGDPAALDPAPAGVDDLVRAAHESEYDVIAAPWVGADDQDDDDASDDAGDVPADDDPPDRPGVRAGRRAVAKRTSGRQTRGQ